MTHDNNHDDLYQRNLYVRENGVVQVSNGSESLETLMRFGVTSEQTSKGDIFVKTIRNPNPRSYSVRVKSVTFYRLNFLIGRILYIFIRDNFYTLISIISTISFF